MEALVRWMTTSCSSLTDKGHRAGRCALGVQPAPAGGIEPYQVEGVRGCSMAGDAPSHELFPVADVLLDEGVAVAKAPPQISQWPGGKAEGGRW